MNIEKRKSKSLLKTLLTTVSLASIAAGGLNTAHAAAVLHGLGVDGGAAVNVDAAAAAATWHTINNVGAIVAHSDGPSLGANIGNPKAIKFLAANTIATMNVANIVAGAFSVVATDTAGQVATGYAAHAGSNIGTYNFGSFFTDNGANLASLDFALADTAGGITVNFNGTGATAADHGFVAAADTCTGLGLITVSPLATPTTINVGHTAQAPAGGFARVQFDPDSAAVGARIAGAGAAAGADLAATTFSVLGGGSVEVRDPNFALTKNIIGAAVGAARLVYVGNVPAAGAPNNTIILQTDAARNITFNGDSDLYLASSAAVNKYTVGTGYLGNNTDGQNTITLDARVADLTLLGAAAVAPAPAIVIGQNDAQRNKALNIYTNAHNVTVDSGVFVQTLNIVNSSANAAAPVTIKNLGNTNAINLSRADLKGYDDAVVVPGAGGVQLVANYVALTADVARDFEDITFNQLADKVSIIADNAKTIDVKFNMIGAGAAAAQSDGVEFQSTGSIEPSDADLAVVPDGLNAPIIVNIGAVAAGGRGTLTVKPGQYLNQSASSFQIAAANNTLSFADTVTIAGGIDVMVVPPAPAVTSVLGTGAVTIGGDIGTTNPLAILNISVAGKAVNYKLGGKILNIINAFPVKADAVGSSVILTNAQNDVSYGLAGGSFAPQGGGLLDASAIVTGKTVTINGNFGQAIAAPVAGDVQTVVKLGASHIKFVPGAKGYVNAVFDGTNDTADLVLDSDGGASYRISAPDAVLANRTLKIGAAAGDSTFYDTQVTFKAIEFSNPISDMLFGDLAGVASTRITSIGDITTRVHEQGAINFLADGVLMSQGNIGAENSTFGTVNVANGKNGTISAANSFFAGLTTIGDGSRLILDGNYTTDSFAGGGAGTSDVILNNSAPATITTNAAAVAPGAVNLTLAGANVTLVNAGAGALSGIALNNINFAPTVAPTANTTLTLSEKITQVVGNVKTLTPTGDNTTPLLVINAPVPAAGVGFTIGVAGRTFGEAGKEVDAVINNDITVDVLSSTYGTIYPQANNTAKVQFNNAANYGEFGDPTHNFKVAIFNSDTRVKSLYSNEASIVAGKLVTFSRGTTSVGNFTVGDNVAKADLSFSNQNILSTNFLLPGGVQQNPSLRFDGAIFLGDVTIGKVRQNIADSYFTGVANSGTVTLENSGVFMDFESSNANIAVTGNSKITGVTNIGKALNLGSSALTLTNDNGNVAGIFNPVDGIFTTLSSDGTSAGSVVLSRSDAAADATGFRINANAITVNFSASGNTAVPGSSFILVDGRGKGLSPADMQKLKLNVTNPGTYVKWIGSLTDNVFSITYADDTAKGIQDDIDAIARGNSRLKDNAATLTDSPAAKTYLVDLAKISNAADRVGSIDRLTGTPAPLVQGELDRQTIDANLKMEGRLGALELGELRGAIGAGDENVGAKVGAWVTPLMSQAIRKKEGFSSGYKSNTGGAILGFDTTPNDNLIIGGAVTLLKTTMKFKDTLAGDKTTADTTMMSLYASQQLVRDWFAQAVVSFGTTKVKNKAQRIVSKITDASGRQTASSNYNSMSYAGEVLFGYNAKVTDSVLFTPMLGVRAAKILDEGYRETGTTNQNRIVTKSARNNAEATAGARVTTAFHTNGVVVMPEAHAFVSQNLGGKSGGVDTRLEGMNKSFIPTPTKISKTIFNLGLGFTAKSGSMEYGAGYDATLARKYVAHQGSLKLRVNF